MSDKNRKKIEKTNDALVKAQNVLGDIYIQNLIYKANPSEGKFMVKKLKEIRSVINVLIGYSV